MLTEVPKAAVYREPVRHVGCVSQAIIHQKPGNFDLGLGYVVQQISVDLMLTNFSSRIERPISCGTVKWSQVLRAGN